MALFSISFDVVGSTSIKSDLSAFAIKHGTDVDRYYFDLAKLMLIGLHPLQ